MPFSSIHFRFRMMLVACALATLVACSTKLNNDNLSKVEAGMKEEQVQAILGKPDRIETAETIGIKGTTYYYKKGETEVQIVFVMGSVISKSGTFK